MPKKLEWQPSIPTTGITLSLYAFPKLTYGDMIRQRLHNRDLALPNKKNQLQTAMRLMLYPSWGILGLSYYNGYNTTTTLTQVNIEPLENNGGWQGRETLTFAKNKMYGLEMAIPWREWKYKLEYALFDTSENLAFGLSHLNGHISAQDKAAPLFNEIINKNNGSFVIPVQYDLLAAGAEAKLKQWYWNLALFYFKKRHPQKSQHLSSLKQKIFPPHSTYKGPFPTLILSRYLGAEKSSIMGMSLGVVGNAGGGAIFYRKTTESMIYTVGLQSRVHFSGESLINTEAEDESFRQKKGISAGPLLAFVYKF